MFNTTISFANDVIEMLKLKTKLEYMKYRADPIFVQYKFLWPHGNHIFAVIRLYSKPATYLLINSFPKTTLGHWKKKTGHLQVAFSVLHSEALSHYFFLFNCLTYLVNKDEYYGSHRFLVCIIVEIGRWLIDQLGTELCVNSGVIICSAAPDGHTKHCVNAGFRSDLCSADAAVAQ